MNEVEIAIDKMVKLKVMQALRDFKENNILTRKDADKLIKRYSTQEYFNKKEAAQYLGKSIPTLNKWIKKYDIPTSIVDGQVIFSKANLDKFMKGKEQ